MHALARAVILGGGCLWLAVAAYAADTEIVTYYTPGADVSQALKTRKAAIGDDPYWTALDGWPAGTYPLLAQGSVIFGRHMTKAQFDALGYEAKLLVYAENPAAGFDNYAARFLASGADSAHTNYGLSAAATGAGANANIGVSGDARGGPGQVTGGLFAGWLTGGGTAYGLRGLGYSEKAGSGFSAAIVGVEGIATHQSSQAIVFDLQGGNFSARREAGASPVQNLVGLEVGTRNSETTGTITGSYGLKVDSPLNSGTIQDQRGLTIDNQRPTGGTFGGTYGLYIANQGSPGAPNTYALYAGGGQSYFGGNVGIGTATPQTALHIAGGTGAALTMGKPTTAPSLSGSNQGRIYFDGTRFMASGNGANYQPLGMPDTADLTGIFGAAHTFTATPGTRPISLTVRLKTFRGAGFHGWYRVRWLNAANVVVKGWVMVAGSVAPEEAVQMTDVSLVTIPFITGSTQIQFDAGGKNASDCEGEMVAYTHM